MPFKNIYIPLLVLLALATGARAQKLQVRSEALFKPIEDVLVYTPKKTFSGLTDSTGVIDISSVGNKDSLIFQHSSHRTFTITKKELARNNYFVLLKSKAFILPDFVYAETKYRERREDVPFKINSISAADIRVSNSATTADLLQNRGDVLVQKSQLGGGSPVLRGFEANRVLMVVDGVRMNNAIYRGGHLQNAITVDQNSLERVEVLFGPSSVIYGSDALGGVMHFYTRNPILSLGDSLFTKVNAFGRYASASQEYTSHVDLNLGWKKFGSFTSVTHSRFSDLRMGTTGRGDYPDLGKVFQYAERINGQDSAVTNSDPNIQRFSGYDQTDITQKFLFRPSSNVNLVLNTQYSTSSDIPRFDNLNNISSSTGLPTFAEWYYGPQERLMVALSTELSSKADLFSSGKIILAFQDIEESRINRRFNSVERSNNIEDVQVYSLNADFQKVLSVSRKFQYGVELSRNDVQSSAFTENINTGLRTFSATRYPDGGSYTQSAALYAGIKEKINKDFLFNAGVRYQYIQLHSDIENNLYNLPFNEIDIEAGALTGSLGVVFRPVESLQFNLAASSGFRAPNVDDYGKIFDRDDRVVVPNNDIKPEFAYNGELGITKKFNQNKIVLNATGFYTYIQNVIVRRDHQLNGEDSLFFNGASLKIQTNTNADEAFIYGLSCTARAQFTEHLNFEGSYNYTIGRDRTNDVPLGHIPPEYGRVSLSFLKGKIYSSAYSLFNGWKRIEDFSPSGVDNEEETTPDGTPAWYTLNFKSGFDLNDRFGVQVAVENILDRHYKPFSSGISAAGRNVIVTLRAGL